jgi:hypothetical protein
LMPAESGNFRRKIGVENARLIDSDNGWSGRMAELWLEELRCQHALIGRGIHPRKMLVDSRT